jgi:outer membrane protein W
MRIRQFLPLAALLVPLVVVDAAQAQKRGNRGVTLEAFGGVALYGRFLEQRIGVAPTLERELTAGNALTLGGAVGYGLWENTSVRAEFTWSGSEFEYKDDSALGDVDVDIDDLADVDVYVASVSIQRLFGPPRMKVRPYGIAGVSANWWNLGVPSVDGPGEILPVGGETQFRWGGVGGVGLLYRAKDRFGVRLEVTRLSSGNPFDGDDAWRTATGETFDEPTTAGFTRVTLGLAYLLR